MNITLANHFEGSNILQMFNKIWFAIWKKKEKKRCSDLLPVLNLKNKFVAHKNLSQELKLKRQLMIFE